MDTVFPFLGFSVIWQDVFYLSFLFIFYPLTFKRQKKNKSLMRYQLITNIKLRKLLINKKMPAVEVE